MAITIIKKYANRRLYDTGDSRYITLEELAEKIRRGAEVRVIDAASDEDLTQSTLAQIILESRGAARLLPVPLLTQLIRMGDDALAEFMGKYLSAALDLYIQAKGHAQALVPMNPFATLPFQLTSGLARLFTGGPIWGGEPPPPPGPMPQPMPQAQSATAPPEPAPPPQPRPPSEPPAASEVAALRRELEELKSVIRAAAAGAAAPRKKPRK